MPQSTDPRDPKTRILKTAGRLFYEQGYQATGINQIIAEAKVAKATFYHHFPSKEDLGVAYLIQYEQQRLHSIQQTLDQHDQPKDQLLALFENLSNWTVARNLHGCPFLNMVSEFQSPDSPIRQRVAAYKNALRQRIHDLVKAALPESTPKEEVSLKANNIYLLYEGAVVDSRVYNDVWPIHSARDCVASLLS